MDRVLLAVASGLAFVGVAAGAFGAHALRARITPEMLAVFQTGVLYHLVHAAALVGVALAAARWPSSLVHAGGWLLVAGILLFSGSLYLLAVTGVRPLGAITPIGGVCFLAGWLCLLVAALRA
jgi:uncharacterized membrane protein YgdD (TMEM256/DUF423 family)